MIILHYATKKSLKESAKAGERVNYTETSIFGNEVIPNGTAKVCGTNHPKRSWFAEIVVNEDLTFRVIA